MRPYMSQRQGDPLIFNLYAVLVHIGGSCNSGHYYCYVKAPNHSWYCMNDSTVSNVYMYTMCKKKLKKINTLLNVVLHLLH